MSMSYLILHNGNQFAKSWAADFYDSKSMDSLVNQWPECPTWNSRIDYAHVHRVCTELTIADNVHPLKLFQLKKTFRIIKTITSFEQDLKHLQGVWLDKLDNWISDYNNIKDESWPACNDINQWESLPEQIKKECLGIYHFREPPKAHLGSKSYHETQWLISLFNNLTVADETVFLNEIPLMGTTTHPEIVFTPGRCGTHVIKAITKVNEQMHHDYQLLEDTKRFQRLIDSKLIISVLRRKFVDFVASKVIGEKYDFNMITKKKNLDKNKTIVSQWKPLELTHDDIDQVFRGLIPYTDLLIGLNLFYHKKIQFSLLENLDHWFDNIEYIKNPYSHRDMIANYDQVVDICTRIYQPVYDQILDKIQTQFGNRFYYR